jgi:hypothetical protein
MILSTLVHTLLSTLPNTVNPWLIFQIFVKHVLYLRSFQSLYMDFSYRKDYFLLYLLYSRQGEKFSHY